MNSDLATAWGFSGEKCAGPGDFELFHGCCPCVASSHHHPRRVHHGQVLLCTDRRCVNGGAVTGLARSYRFQLEVSLVGDLVLSLSPGRDLSGGF